MTVGIGHNSGRVFEPGGAWRTHAWRKARAALLPKLPVEVVRLRVKRAEALGLPYRTYAGLRASTGHDLIGFLFSSNALGLLRPGDTASGAVRDKLSDLQSSRRIGIAHPPLTPADLKPLVDMAEAAPSFALSWAESRDHLKAMMRRIGHPADRFVLVGETAIERDWAEMLQAAAYLPADRYFADPHA